MVHGKRNSKRAHRKRRILRRVDEDSQNWIAEFRSFLGLTLLGNFLWKLGTQNLRAKRREGNNSRAFRFIYMNILEHWGPTRHPHGLGPKLSTSHSQPKFRSTLFSRNFEVLPSRQNTSRTSSQWTARIGSRVLFYQNTRKTGTFIQCVTLLSAGVAVPIYGPLCTCAIYPPQFFYKLQRTVLSEIFTKCSSYSPDIMYTAEETITIRRENMYTRRNTHEYVTHHRPNFCRQEWHNPVGVLLESTSSSDWSERLGLAAKSRATISARKCRRRTTKRFSAIHDKIA